MNRRKETLRIALTAAAAYAAVVALLVITESGAPGASIHSIGDAVWYSIITLTTVGYGDLAPVTAAGKVLGVVLALASLGLLSALIGLIISLISGQTLPRLRLRSRRAAKWYVFSEESEQAAALAESVLSEDPGAVMVFCRTEIKRFAPGNAVRFDCSPEELLDLKGSDRDILVFCLGDDSWDNYQRAASYAAHGISTYCMTDFGPDEPDGNLHTFSRKEIISRCYWRDHPLRRDEKQVVLIGSGSIAAELLETALLTNVFEAGRYVTYHFFGNSAGFRRAHPVIVSALGGADEEDDRLVLHDERWDDRPDIIREADRIIICEDSDREDYRVYKELTRQFPAPGDIHVRLDADPGSAPGFGSLSSIYTLKSLIRDDINRLAVTLHGIYSEGAADPAEWDSLSDHLKRSNIAAADHIIVKVRFLLGDDDITELTEENCRRAYEVFRSAEPELRDACREMEHRRWMRFHQMFNWEYSPERDNLMRKHPLIVPYAELSEDEKEKDAYAWEMISKVAWRNPSA